MKPLPLIIGLVALVGVVVCGFVGMQEFKRMESDLLGLKSSLKESAKEAEARIQKAKEEADARTKELEAQWKAEQKKLLASLKKKADKSEITKISQEQTNEIIKKVEDSVVFVHVGMKGAGSGFAVNDTGMMLTNCHVVQEVQRLSVMTWQEDWVSADVVARDPVADLAILQITDEGMDMLKGVNRIPKGLKFANSDEVKVGDRIFTLGAPRMLTRTVNAGQVSNVDRYLQGLPILNKVSGLYNLYIQVDAGVMPGNSGGPSVNIKGEVIGVNTRANHDNALEGFVVPSNFAKDRMESLLNAPDKTNHYNTLGFEFEPFARRREEASSPMRLLPLDYDAGLLVGRVFQNSPAFKAGIRSNDLILEINGARVNCDDNGKVVAYRRDVAFGKPGSEYDLMVKHLDVRDATGKVQQVGATEKISVKILSEEEYMLPVGMLAMRAYVHVASSSEVPSEYEGAVKVAEMFNMGDMQMFKLNFTNSADYPLLVGDLVVQVEETRIKNIGTLSEAFTQITTTQRRWPNQLVVYREGKKVIVPLRQMQQPVVQQGGNQVNPNRKTEIF
ncbi:MAG: S1C family serine protease [Planctomycetota bacterium]